MPLFLETNQPQLRWNPPPAEPRLIPPRLEDLLRHHRQREEQGHWGGSMRSASSKQARNTRTTIDDCSGPRPPELLSHKNDGARSISASAGEARRNLSSAAGGASAGQQSILAAYAGERIQQLASQAKQQQHKQTTNNSARQTVLLKTPHHLLKRRPKRKLAGSPQEDRAAVPAADRSSSNSSSSFSTSTTVLHQRERGGGTPPTPLCAPAGDKWNERFQELREFKAKMGHCNVPHSYKINAPLARWVKRQRHQYRILMQRYQEQEENQNEKERRQRQNTREVAILESQELLPMSTLVRLTSSGASSTATTNHSSSRSPISSGVTTRSTPAALAAPISSLTPERIEALQDLGFVWDVYRDCWQDKIGELRAYKEKHSNCDVPCRYAENPQLAIWVKCQRRQYKLYTEGRPSSITLERIRELEQMGFCWGMRTYKNRGGGSSLSSQSRDA
uniref:Helicase-associated domain-containing protein n=1 Tax=Entomoneis paludosa TaxID=265537 RepID=A0A7S3DUQ4_9STRA